MRLPPFNPYIIITIASIAISTTAVFVKLAGEAPAGIIAFYRLLFAVLIMLPIVLIGYRHELRMISKKDWGLSVISGVFLALHFILWFESLSYTSVASSTVLVTMQSVFAFLGTYILFQERFSYAAIISMIITVFGGIIITWGDFQLSEMALFGDILALLGALAITVYFLVGQRTRKRVSLMTYTFIVYSIGAITLFLYNSVVQHSFTGYSADYWWVFLALAIIPTFLGRTLLNWAQRWLASSTISLATLFEPVGATILAYYFLRESVTWSQFLGGAIVLFGLYLFIISTNQKKKVTISKKSKEPR